MRALALAVALGLALQVLFLGILFGLDAVERRVQAAGRTRIRPEAATPPAPPLGEQLAGERPARLSSPTDRVA